MADGQGLISQALANMETVRAHLASLTCLPASAEAARTTVQQSVTSIIPAVQASSQSVGAYVDTATPLAAVAMAALDRGDPGQVEQSLAEMQTASAPAKAAVDAATAAIQTTMSDVNTQIVALDQAESALQQQISQASNELSEAQAEAADLDKKKYYWLLLGPLGLAGLAACIALIVTASQKVTGLQNRASQLRAQVAQWSKMKSDVDLVVRTAAARFEAPSPAEWHRLRPERHRRSDRGRAQGGLGICDRQGLHHDRGERTRHPARRRLLTRGVSSSQPSKETFS
jgi:hypothetical protein